MRLTEEQNYVWDTTVYHKLADKAREAVQIMYLKQLQEIEENGDCPVTSSKIKGYR